jgi:hypothetical protein
MKLEQYQIDHLYDEIYHIDGRGLMDYLRVWRTMETDIYPAATQHGEKLFLHSVVFPIPAIDIFDRWSAWRHEVTYHFDSFIREQEKVNLFSDIKELKEYFVYKICVILGIIEKTDRYLPISGPKSIQDDPLLFS